jgi:hypothetical protein
MKQLCGTLKDITGVAGDSRFAHTIRIRLVNIIAL